MFFKSFDKSPKPHKGRIVTPKETKYHNNLRDFLRECALDEYEAQLVSIGICSIDDLIRCSDELVEALVGDRVVHKRKMKDLVKVVYSAKKDLHGRAQIVVGSMAPGASEDLSIPRSLEAMSKSELIELVNKYKKDIAIQDVKMHEMIESLNHERKLREKAESVLESLMRNGSSPSRAPPPPSSIRNTLSFNEPETPINLQNLPRKGIFDQEPLSATSTLQSPIQSPRMLSSNNNNTSTTTLSGDEVEGRESRSTSFKSSSSRNKHLIPMETISGGDEEVHPTSPSPTSTLPDNDNDSIRSPGQKEKQKKSITNKNSTDSSMKRQSPNSPKKSPASRGAVSTSRPKVIGSRNTINSPRSNNKSPTRKVVTSSGGDDLSFEDKLLSNSPLRNRKPSPVNTGNRTTSPKLKRSSLNPRSRSSPRVSLRKYGESTKTPDSAGGSTAPSEQDVSQDVKKMNQKQRSVSESANPNPRMFHKQGSSSSSSSSAAKLVRTQSGRNTVSVERNLSSSSYGVIKNSHGDDTLESKIMNGVPEPSFEQKLLKEHRKSERKKSQSQERGGKGMIKQDSLEDKVITATYERWIPLFDAEAFQAEGSLCQLYFEAQVLSRSQSGADDEGDVMLRELKDKRQIGETKMAARSLRDWVQKTAFSTLILCGSLHAITPSSNVQDTTSMMSEMLSPNNWPNKDKTPKVCAFVRRSEVPQFRQLWGKLATEKQLSISLFAVPDRLTQQQVGLYVFSRTQVSTVAVLTNALTHSFNPPLATLNERIEACGAPVGCQIALFLPSLSPSIPMHIDEEPMKRRKGITIVHSPSS